VTAGSPSNALKVLVADDSESERASARSALAAAGYKVVEAIDGQHALEVFARERPDLVMLDVVMPRLTGLETCRILKAKSQSTYLPVIMVSTRNSVNARVEGLRSGADDYLGKPYDVEELRARVEALLRTRKLIGDDGGAETEDYKRRLEEEFDRAERYSDPLACLRVELDGLHALEADPRRDIVERLRGVIESSIRKIDHVYRRDDRGYIIVLPNTHFPGALAVAERVSRDARVLELPAQAGIAPSVSVGVSFFPNKETHSLADLLDLVDAALARAKGEGGGKICLFQHQGYLYAPE
jgi:diguanylate cyclase (GGDEF)-like protein